MGDRIGENALLHQVARLHRGQGNRRAALDTYFFHKGVMAEIARLLKGKYAMMNFIPYNSNEGLGFARPSWERASEMAGRLHQRGILTRLRNSAGQDIDGGCGQLRARAAARAL